MMIIMMNETSDLIDVRHNEQIVFFLKLKIIDQSVDVMNFEIVQWDWSKNEF